MHHKFSHRVASYSPFLSLYHIVFQFSEWSKLACLEIRPAYGFCKKLILQRVKWISQCAVRNVVGACRPLEGLQCIPHISHCKKNFRAQFGCKI